MRDKDFTRQREEKWLSGLIQGCIRALILQTNYFKLIITLALTSSETLESNLIFWVNTNHTCNIIELLRGLNIILGVLWLPSSLGIYQVLQNPILDYINGWDFIITEAKDTKWKSEGGIFHWAKSKEVRERLLIPFHSRFSQDPLSIREPEGHMWDISAHWNPHLKGFKTFMKVTQANSYYVTNHKNSELSINTKCTPHSLLSSPDKHAHHIPLLSRNSIWQHQSPVYKHLRTTCPDTGQG